MPALDTSDEKQVGLEARLPKTDISFFAGADGRSPVVEWLEQLRARDPPAYAKCAAAIKRLEDADLGRHSVAVLERVAAALGLRLEIRFVEQRRRARRA